MGHAIAGAGDLPSSHLLLNAEGRRRYLEIDQILGKKRKLAVVLQMSIAALQSSLGPNLLLKFTDQFCNRRVSTKNQFTRPG